MYKITDRKLFPKTTGIYKIYFLNANNNNVYIGSASGKNGFFDRWRRHIYDMRKNISGCVILQNAFNKYGENNMIFEIIEECDSLSCLLREQFYIDKYNSYNLGYNARPQAANNGGLNQTEYNKKVLFEKYKKIRDSYSEEVKKLYSDGKTTREICKALNISRNFLHKIFKENNIISRKESGLKKRKIYQYDLDGNFIKSFESINECSKQMSVNVQGINLVLRGKTKHCKNFFYSFLKLDKSEIENILYEKIIQSKNRKYLNVKQIDKSGKIIKIWRDCKEIYDANVAKHNGLNKALRLGLLYNGYYWQL
jgi:group I intron endonuclease